MGLLRENKDLLVKLTSLPDPAGALRKSVAHLVSFAQATSTSVFGLFPACLPGFTPRLGREVQFSLDVLPPVARDLRAAAGQTGGNTSPLVRAFATVSPPV
jgi:hypothetical protein